MTVARDYGQTRQVQDAMLTGEKYGTTHALLL
ncbi:hypothetical protein CCP4SC76_5280006 [Gammaproteobacteria bacterium]